MEKLIFKILRYSFLPFIFREVVQRRKVTILMFHDIGRDDARKAFFNLKKNYNIISLNTFIDSVEKKDKTMLPRKAAVLTFDDGHIRNYELLPVLKEMNIPVTIFLCSGIINTNRDFWFHFRQEGIQTSFLKTIPNSEKLTILSAAGFCPEKEFENPSALQKHQIDEMRPFVNFQSHTVFHPCLPKCSDSEAREEIFKSKQVLEEQFSLSINAIAYPNGDYSDRDIEFVRQAGYKCAVTVDYGFNTISSDMFRLKRVSVSDTGNLDELIVKSSGLWGFVKTMAGKKNDWGYSDSAAG